jgi:hypothetical protein
VVAVTARWKSGLFGSWPASENSEQLKEAARAVHIAADLVAQGINRREFDFIAEALEKSEFDVG